MMDYTFEQYQASADTIRSRLGGFVPEVALVLGSGLGFLGDVVENAIAVPYGDIPHFKASTAPGATRGAILLQVLPCGPGLYFFNGIPIAAGTILDAAVDPADGGGADLHGFDDLVIGAAAQQELCSFQPLGHI